MNERERNRRKTIATLTVVLPVIAGLIIVALGHFLGNEETDVAKPKEATQVEAEAERQTAAAPAAAGTPAPRVRLTEAATGKRFDSSSLGSEPYAVVFVTTKCEAIGAYLGKAATELSAEGDADAVLAISGDPGVDSKEAVAAYLAKHGLKGGPLHYLVGTEDELSGFWNAFGFDGPSSACPPSVPAYLVNGKDENAGIVDLDPHGSPTLLDDALAGMAR
jgi:cytochrome oxidase Cu insertion factor (SCO1/SenC/PrrC family)